MFRVLLLTILMCFSFITHADVPLAPIDFTLKQPDGFSFKAKSFGNRQYHWIETLDGHRITQDKNKQWCYVLLDKHLKPYRSDIAVGELQKHSQSGKKIKLPTRAQFAQAKAKLEQKKKPPQ